MNKINIILFCLFGLLMTKEKFIFLFEIDGDPYNKNIECILKDQNYNIIKKFSKIEKGKKYKSPKKVKKYSDNKYYQFVIEYDFQKYFEKNNEFILEFSGTYDGSYVSGQQKFNKNFWWGDNIKDKDAIIDSEGFSSYFKESVCLKETYSPIIEIQLKQSRLEFEAEIFNSQGSPIESENFQVYPDKSFNRDLKLSNIIQSNGRYKCIIKAKDGSIDNVKKNSSKYRLYFLGDNFKAYFVEIDTDKLLKNKKQIETIDLEQTYPYTVMEEYCDGGMKWNQECGKCICQKGYTYNKQLNKCVVDCNSNEIGYIKNDGDWVCEPNYELIEFKKKQSSKINDEINTCIDSNIKKLETYYGKLSNFEKMYLKIIENKEIEINQEKKDQFRSICEDKIYANLGELGVNKNQYTDIRDEFYNKYDECEPIDDISYYLCSNEKNQDYISDIFFLIDISEVLYRKIRKSSELSFPDIFNKINSSDQDIGSQLSDIIQLQLLYFKIDYLIKNKQSNKQDLALNSYKNIQSEKKVLTNHYLERLHFFEWYFNVLFNLSKNDDEGNLLTEIDKINQHKINDYWMSYSDLDNVCYNSSTMSYIEWLDKKPSEVLMNLYSKDMPQLRYYYKLFDRYRKQAKKYEGLSGGEKIEGQRIKAYYESIIDEVE